MPWYPSSPEPPAPLPITGWWAVLQLLATQQISMSTLGRVVGIVAAAQTFSLSNAGIIGLYLQANQSVSLANSAVGKGVQQGNQSFSLTSYALFGNAAIAANELTLTQLATVVGVANALQQLPITNQATAAALQHAEQTMALEDNAFAAGVMQGVQVMDIIDQASWAGAPRAENAVGIQDSATVVGLVLSEQQIQLLNEGNVTGFEGSLTAWQTISVVNAADVAGMQLAGQSFTVVDSSVFAGKPGAANAFALTSSGAAKAVSLAGVQFVLSNTGTVYAKVNAAQSFSLGNSATAQEVVSNTEFVNVNGIHDKSTDGQPITLTGVVAGSSVILTVNHDRAIGHATPTCNGAAMDFVASMPTFPGAAAGARFYVYVKHGVSAGTATLTGYGATTWTAASVINYKNASNIKVVGMKQGVGTQQPSQPAPAPPTNGKSLFVIGGGKSPMNTITGTGVTDRYSPNGVLYSGAGYGESDQATTFLGTTPSGTGTTGYSSLVAHLSADPIPGVGLRDIGDGIYTADSKTTSGSFTLRTKVGDCIIFDVVGDDYGTVVTYNGVNLTLLASYQLGLNFANQQLASFQRFAMIVTSANAGSKTLAWTGSTPAGGTQSNAVVFSDVVSIGTTTHAYGTGGTPATPSIAASCGANERIAIGFGAATVSAHPAISSNMELHYRRDTVNAMYLNMLSARASGTFSIGPANFGNWNAFATVLKVT